MIGPLSLIFTRWARLPGGAELARRPRPSGGDRAGAGLRVLLVDDVSMNLDIARSFLETAGHRTTCVDNGQTALETAAADDFDVILLDVRMPGMDGLETARRIRALPPPRNRIRIVAMTSQTFGDQLGQCHEAGMDELMAKPVEKQALLATVTKAACPSHAQEAGAEAAAAPDLNESIYLQLSEMLKPDDVDRHLQKLMEMAQQLLALLTAQRGHPADADLLHHAHRLGGSAGLFGFERLLDEARHFERAAETGASEAGEYGERLLAATTRALALMEGMAAGRLAAAEKRPLAAI